MKQECANAFLVSLRFSKHQHFFLCHVSPRHWALLARTELETQRKVLIDDALTQTLSSLCFAPGV